MPNPNSSENLNFKLLRKVAKNFRHLYSTSTCRRLISPWSYVNSSCRKLYLTYYYILILLLEAWIHFTVHIMADVMLNRTGYNLVKWFLQYSIWKIISIVFIDIDITEQDSYKCVSIIHCMNVVSNTMILLHVHVCVNAFFLSFFLFLIPEIFELVNFCPCKCLKIEHFVNFEDHM